MAFPSAPTAGGGSVDELPDLGGFSPPIAAAPVLMPSLVEERPKWILPTVIGLGGLLVVTLVVLVVVLAFRKPEPVTVAATLPMPGTSQVQPPPPKAPELPMLKRGQMIGIVGKGPYYLVVNRSALPTWWPRIERHLELLDRRYQVVQGRDGSRGIVVDDPQALHTWYARVRRAG